MAFGATLTVTINAVAKVLNRINQDNYGSEYMLRSTTDEFRVKIRHSKENSKNGVVMERHNVEITHTVFATATTDEVVRSTYIVVRGKLNDDVTPLGYLLAGFVTYVSNATVQSDLLSWQS
jgi:hypothetical protein